MASTEKLNCYLNMYIYFIINVKYFFDKYVYMIHKNRAINIDVFGKQTKNENKSDMPNHRFSFQMLNHQIKIKKANKRERKTDCNQ